MSQLLEVQGGELEFIPTPGHVNIIAADGADTAELRLDPIEWDQLRHGMGADQRTDIDTESGMISWEPGRGLYVELYDGPDFYVVFSPEDRNGVVSKMLTTQAGS